MPPRFRCLAVPLCLLLGTPPSCSPLGPESGGSHDVVVTTNSLTALLKLPQAYDSSKAYPLLVALHGNGGTAQGFAPAFSSFARDSLLVAVPEGEHPGPGGGRSWFYLTQDRSLWEECDTRSVDHVVELATAIAARHRVDGVFMLGFSQGASLAYMVGLRNPSQVRGVVAIGGVFPDVDQPGAIVHASHVQGARNVKIFVARGITDLAVSREAFVSQRDFLLAHGYSVTAYEYAGGHVLTEDLLARVRAWIRAQPAGAAPQR